MKDGGRSRSLKKATQSCSASPTCSCPNPASLSAGVELESAQGSAASPSLTTQPRTYSLFLVWVHGVFASLPPPPPSCFLLPGCQ